MNFINDKELALRFKNDAVPSRERLIYLILFALPLYVLTSQFFIQISAAEETRYFHHILDSSLIVLNLIGIIFCYRTNRDGDNVEFIERFVSLSFPIFVRYGGVLIGCFLLFGLAYYNKPEFAEIEIIQGYVNVDEAITCVCTAGYYIASYFRLNSSIRLASH
jgi:hypothetical protein